jgi:NAD(P)H dehydrogenase (quinone)
VIEPFVAYAPARMGADERLACLSRYRERVLALGSAPTIAAPDIAAYDGLVLKSAAR